MNCLLTGDLIFSSWTFRAKLACDVCGIQYFDRYVGLDWPINFDTTPASCLVENVGSRKCVEGDVFPGCKVHASQITRHLPANNSSSKLLEFTSRLPVLITNDSEVYFDVSSIIQWCFLSSGIEVTERQRQLAAHFYNGYSSILDELSYPDAVRGRPNTNQKSPRLQEQLRIFFGILNESLAIWSQDRDEGPNMCAIHVCSLAYQLVRHRVDFGEYSKVRGALERLLSFRYCQKLIQSAEKIYSDRYRHQINTPAWVAAQYRRHPDLPIIHDWIGERYHYLENDVADFLFTEAANGAQTDDLVIRLSKEYEINEADARADIEEFFKKLNPNSEDNTHESSDFKF